MKYIYLVALLLAIVAFSGCMEPTPKEWSELSAAEKAQLNPEEKAIAIADDMPEIKLILKAVESMQRADQCTFDKLLTGMKKVYEIDGRELPEMDESQKTQTKEMLQQMGALVKRCNVTISKSVEKESEDVYIVRYKPETISDPECNIISTADTKISVNISTEKANLVGGSSGSDQDMEKYEEAINMMGDCIGIMMISSTVQVGQATTTQEVPITQELPATEQPITQVPPSTESTQVTIIQDGQEYVIQAPNTQTVQANALPTADTTSGTESVMRYPGSIMLSHSSMTDEYGFHSIVAYGTTSHIDAVESWYKSLLENAGWQFTIEYAGGTIKSFVYNKQTSQESVTITLASENEYTGITITYEQLN